jgi:hypothetical protein
MATIKEQLQKDVVALISLTVAVIALLYTGWREETSEKHRNIRVAGFEVLKNLGELQVVVNETYYEKGSAFLGWGHIALISDLSQLLPKPVPDEIKKLIDVWGQDWGQLKENESAVNQVTDRINQSREVVLKTIKRL